jgi:hypothetical protein
VQVCLFVLRADVLVHVCMRLRIVGLLIHENVWYGVTCKPSTRLAFRYDVHCNHLTASLGPCCVSPCLFGEERKDFGV